MRLLLAPRAAGSAPACVSMFVLWAVAALDEIHASSSPLPLPSPLTLPIFLCYPSSLCSFTFTFPFTFTFSDLYFPFYMCP